VNLALINPRVWLEIALAALIAGACWWAYNAVYDRGAASVQTAWDKDKAEQAQASAKVATDALATTKALAATIETQRSDFNAQMSGVSAIAARAVAGLSNRPSRDSSGSVPRDPTTGAATGATGADLLRQDSAFLIGESARADKLRLQLAQCQAAYQSAREALSK
jgi:hypothetical protein